MVQGRPRTGKPLRWDFASGCRAANWMGAHALVEEENGGALRLNSYGRPGQRILLHWAHGRFWGLYVTRWQAGGAPAANL